MTTLRQIITDSLRESGIIAAGATPEADEFDEGLRRLQTMIKTMYGTLMGEKLETMSFGDEGLVNTYAKAEDESSYINSSYVPYNTRLICNIGDATTLYLHPNPQDGARFAIIDNAGTFDTSNVTLNANGRQIESAATVTLSTADMAREWFYRAELGEWVRVTDLTADSESPFPQDFDDLLITLLAIRLNPRYGVKTAAETGAIMRDVKTMFRSRYRQKIEMPIEEGLLRLPSDKSMSYGSSTDRFNRGRP